MSMEQKRFDDMLSLIQWMGKEAQSFTLNYGEDTGAWECSWVLRGERFSGFHPRMINAIHKALNAAGLVGLIQEEEGRLYLIVRQIDVDWLNKNKMWGKAGLDEGREADE